ncbi:MAG: DUF6463 family protein [Roseateles sp.]|uniref:DUF6463 family protein n=1 Tax=Roseateles sp. TaxID=1971397 RepID=UPI00403703BA
MTFTARRPWIGPWLMLVAVIHTVFGLVVFAPVLSGMLERGLFNSVGSDAMAGAVTWFMLFGGPLALVGWQVWSAERRAAWVELRVLGWGILALTILGLLLMPMSGFWLALPAAWGLLRRPTGTRVQG